MCITLYIFLAYLIADGIKIAWSTCLTVWVSVSHRINMSLMVDDLCIYYYLNYINLFTIEAQFTDCKGP